MYRNPAKVFLRRREVEHRTGLSRSQIYAAMDAGTFPRPVNISTKAVGWIEDEIEAWQIKRIERRVAITA